MTKPVKVRGVNWFGMNYERRWSKLIGMYKQDAEVQNLVRSTEQSASSFSSSKSTRFHVLPNPVKLNSWCMANTPACQLCQKRDILEHGLSCGEVGGRMTPLAPRPIPVADTISTGIPDSKNQFNTPNSPLL